MKASCHTERKRGRKQQERQERGLSAQRTGVRPCWSTRAVDQAPPGDGTGDAVGHPSPDCEKRDKATQTRSRHPGEMRDKRRGAPKRKSGCRSRVRPDVRMQVQVCTVHTGAPHGVAGLLLGGVQCCRRVSINEIIRTMQPNAPPSLEIAALRSMVVKSLTNAAQDHASHPAVARRTNAKSQRGPLRSTGTYETAS